MLAEVLTTNRALADAGHAACPCGSGKKYKKCYGRSGVERASGDRPAGTPGLAPLGKWR